MASTIQLRTGTGSAVPSALTQGEVAINVTNGLVYYGSGSGNDVKQLESFTHITASGNISGSSTSTITIGGTLTAGGVIVSPNISSLTTVTGSLLNSIDSISATTESLLNSIDSISATTESLLNSIDSISTVTGSYAITGSNVLFGNITASGNISASGRIYGRQFEQIETNFSENLGTRGVVYMPFSNQSISDNANSSNINVNRVAAVPGKPVKSVIRAISNTLGNNAQYTMSYWEAAAGDPTNPILKSAAYAITDASSNKDAITFDFTDPGSGSTTDVAVGSRIWMTLEAEGTGNGSFIVTHVWEWDYNSIM